MLNTTREISLIDTTYNVRYTIYGISDVVCSSVSFVVHTCIIHNSVYLHRWCVCIIYVCIVYTTSCRCCDVTKPRHVLCNRDQINPSISRKWINN